MAGTLFQKQGFSLTFDCGTDLTGRPSNPIPPDEKGGGGGGGIPPGTGGGGGIGTDGTWAGFSAFFDSSVKKELPVSYSVISS